MSDPANPPALKARPGVSVLVNAKAGAAQTTDRDQALEALRGVAAAHGRPETVAFLEPEDFVAAIRAECARDDVGIIIVGGGDGSISTAGDILAGSDTALGVIPLGTFNLFARSLNMPIPFEEAVEALRTGELDRVDVGEIDGKVYLHAISLGVHPTAIQNREAMSYNSRASKMLAGARAWAKTLRRLVSVPLAFSGDYSAPMRRYRQVGVTVGAFPEGRMALPYADDLTQGELDLLLLSERSRWEFLRAAISIAMGRWQSSPYVENHRVRELTIQSRHPLVAVSVDGEVHRMRTPIRVRVRPKALAVLRARKPDDVATDEGGG